MILKLQKCILCKIDDRLNYDENIEVHSFNLRFLVMH